MKPRPLTVDDVPAVAAAVAERLTDTLNLSPDEHREQHAFLTAWMERERRKTEMWEKVKAELVGRGAWALLLALLGMLGVWLKVQFGR